MKQKQKVLMALSIMLVLVFGVTQSAGAMHIMEGYLPPTWCIAWGVVCLPFFLGGVWKIQKLVSENRRTLLILAMVGAYAAATGYLKEETLEELLRGMFTGPKAALVERNMQAMRRGAECVVRG